ncbi:agmatine deiminase family protein [Pseudovibrio sp. Ad26]|uniref:agmatine deiminase family protein n=1 Tax=Pseudovibrio sp. Ad26 TaxID=989410 RepID=UPI0007AEE28D|nr:agmatine deiminase family protein [Pseudovibrio sp. Ad26]KZL12902.1 Agmatine deiminase [Pseudovibrio sp. Ad26]
MKNLRSKIQLLACTLLASVSVLLTTGSFTAALASDRDLILIAAPSIADTYDEPEYAALFQDIIDFDIAYANAVYGNDEVRIVVDAQTRSYFKGKVPDEILLTDYLPHIWARDYTVINPSKPVQFRYTPVTFEGDQAVADEMQNGFNAFAKAKGLTFTHTGYMLDGGNIVDNHAGRVITTTRFLEDNDLSYEDGKAVLEELLNAKEVAILPPDEEVMAHSDGMVMFAEENTIILNRYDAPMRTEITEELEASFPGIKIVEVDAMWDEDDLSSACGVNVNAAMTSKYIYMPHFGDRNSDAVLKTIQANTSKTVIPVPANKVCKLGGSVRCLTLQLKGKAAQAILRN